MFQQIADYGVAIVALVVVSLFAWWLVRFLVSDLTARLDRSLALNEKQITATEKLTETVNALVDLIRERRK